jgi:hypothetical protein
MKLSNGKGSRWSYIHRAVKIPTEKIQANSRESTDGLETLSKRTETKKFLSPKPQLR